jgi:hypothetical protein
LRVPIASRTMAAMPEKHEPTDAEIDLVMHYVVETMRGHLEAAGMDSSRTAVRDACKRQMRALVALRELQG